MHSQRKRVYFRVVILIKSVNGFCFSGFNPACNAQQAFLYSLKYLLHSLRVSHNGEEDILENIQPYGINGAVRI